MRRHAPSRRRRHARLPFAGKDVPRWLPVQRASCRPRGDRTVTASAQAHASLRSSVPIRGACLPSCRRTRPNGEQTRGEITAGRALP